MVWCVEVGEVGWWLRWVVGGVGVRWVGVGWVVVGVGGGGVVMVVEGECGWVCRGG